ncbi:head-tail connector protein [Candidatus Pantoea multigeneris]|uniref:Phage gp6-like head-tail connector protein n=1 Tax=Candidatus Pantoea multigeneris TaxID=2608357 RepID=A0ABX0R8X0_9GAMM|nr:head-tail connector protein [Pantoea multigeneris]NIF20583.1 phage gp6-like head-tail connector protein [Pantoea multigeneris]
MLTVEQVKHHCNLELGFTEDDVWIAGRIKAAVKMVEKSTRRTLYESADDPGFITDRDSLLYGEDIETAMLMLIAHWYANREAVVTGLTSTSLDYAVEAILQPYRIYGV